MLRREHRLAQHRRVSRGRRSRSAEQVTITFWGSYGNGGNSSQQDVLNKTLIPAFEASHPGIKVEYVDVPYDDLLQKLTTSAAADELPDLVRADLGWVPRFADLGVLVPLSDVMPDFQELADATFPGVLATNLFEGKYYGLPLDTNTRVLITNPDVLAKAGLDAPPATFDEFVAFGQALKGSDVSLFADGGLGAWNIMPWIWSGGGDITDPELTTSTGVLDSDANVATVQMLVDLYSDGLVSSGIIGNEGAVSTSDGLPNGNYATILDGPWMSGIWARPVPRLRADLLPGPGRSRRLGERRRRRGHRADRGVEAPGGGAGVHQVHPVGRVPARAGPDRPADRDQGAG